MRGALALCVLVALGLAGWSSAAWAQRPGCAGADALAGARLLGDAVAEYDRLAAGAAPTVCSRAAPTAATRKRAEQWLGEAEMLRAEQGRRADARDRFRDVLEIDVSLEAAVSGLDELTEVGTGDRCADARALQEARLLAQAAEELRGTAAATCPDARRDEVAVAREQARAALAEGIRHEYEGSLVFARGAYETAAATDASLEDARTRLIDLVSGARLGGCAAADSLYEARLLEPAELLYLELQAGDAPPPCAATGAETVAKEREKAAAALTAGKELEADDSTAAARAKYQDAATQDASLAEARDRLVAITDAGAPLPDDVSAFLSDALPWLGLAAGAVVGLVLLGSALLRVPAVKRRFVRWIWLVHEGRSTVGLTAGQRLRRAVLRVVLVPDRGATRTGLKVDDFGSTGGVEGGKALAAAVRAFLPRMGSRRLRTVDVVSTPFAAPAALTELSTAVSAVPHGRLWAAVLSLAGRLLPRETLQLTGQVLGLRDGRMGLSLVLSRAGGKTIDAVTLWADEFPGTPPGKPDADDERLDPVELRLAFVGAAWTAFRFLRHRHVMRPGDWRANLGTGSWRSYALVQLGAIGRPDREPEEALAIYAQARNEDPGNLSAVFDLAVARLRLGDPQGARGLLEKLRPLVESATLPGTSAPDPLRFQVAYQCGDEAVQQHFRPGGRRPDLPKAYQDLRAELRALHRQLAALDRRGERRNVQEVDMTAELNALRGPMVVLGATLARLVRGDELASIPAIGRLFALAPDVSERTHYNLACYYGTHEPDKAYYHLAQGTQSESQRRWAREDPTLKGLARDRARWNEALGRGRPKPPPAQGLAALESIGAHAAGLAGVQITTAAGLAERCRFPHQRLVLSDALRVGPQLVERWARLCEVKHSLVLGEDEANQLDRASMASIGALARQPSPEWLSDVLRLADPDAELPDNDRLDAWIEEAKQRPERVLPALGR